jgi:hypothetical protein
MEKIVLNMAHSEERARLIQCLNLLFPECEIEVRPVEGDRQGSHVEVHRLFREE